MDFTLTEEQEAIAETVRDFGRADIAPHAARWEHEGTIPRSVLGELGALGFGGIYVSRDHGGSGLTRLDAPLIFEALGESYPSFAVFVSIHNMCAWVVNRFGSPKQCAELLPGLCSTRSPRPTA